MICAKKRQVSPDLAKGIGIILVVIGHTIRGLMKANILPATEKIILIDTAIYLFHMPLFFYISGLFLEQRINRSTFFHFIQKSFLILLIPLLFWSYLQTFIQFIFSNNINSSVKIIDLLMAPFPPKQQFWFLWALFLDFIFFAIMQKMNISKFSRIITFIIILFLALLNDIFNASYISDKIFNIPIIGQSITFFPFLLLGSLHGYIRESTKHIKLFYFVLFFTISIITYLFIGDLLPSISFYVFSILSIVTLYRSLEVLSLKTYNTKNKLIDILIYIGLNSMIIYLAHIITEAGIRVFLLKNNIVNINIHLIMGILFGIFVPLLLGKIFYYYKKDKYKIFNYIIPIKNLESATK